MDPTWVSEKELASRDQGWDCMRNGPAISTDRAALAGGLAAGVVLGTLVIVDGLSRGDALPSTLFIALYVAVATGMIYGNRRRRPVGVGFSEDGVRVEYRRGRTRFLPWETIASVHLKRFRRDVYVDIRYVDGRVEGKAHIYGEAALELKRRFEEWQASSTS